jgi:hypothetical protein
MYAPPDPFAIKTHVIETHPSPMETDPGVTATAGGVREMERGVTEMEFRIVEMDFRNAPTDHGAGHTLPCESQMNAADTQTVHFLISLEFRTNPIDQCADLMRASHDLTCPRS